MLLKFKKSKKIYKIKKNDIIFISKDVNSKERAIVISGKVKKIEEFHTPDYAYRITLNGKFENIILISKEYIMLKDTKKEIFSPIIINIIMDKNIMIDYQLIGMKNDMENLILLFKGKFKYLFGDDFKHLRPFNSQKPFPNYDIKMENGIITLTILSNHLHIINSYRDNEVFTDDDDI